MINDHILIMLESLGISPETLSHLLFTHWSILLKSWWLVLNKFQMSWVKILEAQRGIESSQCLQGRKTLKTKVKEMKSWQNNQSCNKTGSKKIKQHTRLYTSNKLDPVCDGTQPQDVLWHFLLGWAVSTSSAAGLMLLLVTNLNSLGLAQPLHYCGNVRLYWGNSCEQFLFPRCRGASQSDYTAPWSEPHRRFHPVGVSTQQLPADDTCGLLYYVSRFFRFVKSGMLHDTCARCLSWRTFLSNVAIFTLMHETLQYSQVLSWCCSQEPVE